MRSFVGSRFISPLKQFLDERYRAPQVTTVEKKGCTPIVARVLFFSGRREGGLRFGGYVRGQCRSHRRQVGIVPRSALFIR